MTRKATAESRASASRRHRRDDVADGFVIGSERMLDAGELKPAAPGLVAVPPDPLLDIEEVEDARDVTAGAAAEESIAVAEERAIEAAEPQPLDDEQVAAPPAAWELSQRMSRSVLSQRILAFGALASAAALLASALVGQGEQEADEDRAPLGAREAARVLASPPRGDPRRGAGDARPQQRGESGRRAEPARKHEGEPETTAAPHSAPAPDPAPASEQVGFAPVTAVPPAPVASAPTLGTTSQPSSSSSSAEPASGAEVRQEFGP